MPKKSPHARAFFWQVACLEQTGAAAVGVDGGRRPRRADIALSRRAADRCNPAGAAAVDHAGEKDDGETLTAMRKLRDDYLRKFPEGRKEIEWYYRKAPKIVAAIDKKPNAHARPRCYG